MNTERKARVIRPKLYHVATRGGAQFYVRALSAPAARRFVVETLEGALTTRAVHDDEAFQLGRDGVEVLDATRED